MRFSSFSLRQTLQVGACLMFCVASVAAIPALEQTVGAAQTFDGRASFLSAQDKDQVKLSGGESKAAEKIDKAADPAAKLKAAEEFLKKYPKSQIRAQIAEHVAARINGVSDPAQKLSLTENFLNIFTEASEADIITPVVIDAYLALGRTDDALELGARYLEKRPNDIFILTQLALQGTIKTQSGDSKYLARSKQYGAKAIEMLEGNQKPASLDEAQWKAYKESWLPRLYQALGVLAMLGGDQTEALNKLQQADKLNPGDPGTIWMIGGIKNDEYQKTAREYKAMPASPAQNELLKKANAQIDEVIEIYARVVALTAGNPQYKQMHDQALSDLQSYYKYRHEGKTDGMQQLIDKHKVAPSKPQ
jgi:hypothetical protein